MAATSEVLQEYLIKLGYTVDQVSLGKFNAGINNTGKNILKVGGAVAGVVASVEAATAAFAYSMRKTYFESQLANSSIKNLAAFGYAGKQIGIGGDAIASGLQHMSRGFRSLAGPGLRAMITGLTGVQTEGRKSDEVMKDILQSLKAIPPELGQMYAQQFFGWDSDTYHLVMSNIDKFTEKQKEATDIYKSFGLDQDKAAGAMLHYAETMDKLKEQFKALGAVLLINFAPVFDSVNEKLSLAMTRLAALANGTLTWGALFKNAFSFKTDEERKNPQPPKEKSFWNWLKSSPSDYGQAPSAPGAKKAPAATLPPPIAPASAAGGSTQAAGGLFANLESTYGLPAGLLDKVWKQESGRGTSMLSSAGAKGHFQFMDKTAKQYGVNDPNDLKESATGAAKMYGDLLKKYNNDVQLALAAYNWGQGNVDAWLKTGKGMKGQDLPKETLDYVAKISGNALGQADNVRLGGSGASQVTNNITTTVTVAGVSNPQENARAISSELMRVNQDALRNAQGALR